MAFSRYLQKYIETDLQQKMVFIGGPRQVGKTTLSKNISLPFAYLNWDSLPHREAILKHELPLEPLLILDEIHKYSEWRNLVKGVFDTQFPQQNILVTGSAHLDWYRYGGDSLQGRYFHYHLMPFCVYELGIETLEDFHTLLTLGGFPEPFLKGSAKYAKRWSQGYRERLLYDDVQTLENLQSLSKMEHLLLRLPQLVGSPLSINALRQDLQLNHQTVGRWIEILERLYAIFRVSPFGAPQIRAVKKEQKHYHLDWSLVESEGDRFENLVAVHLLKWIYFQKDTQGELYELRYFRDIDQREVDFVVMHSGKAKWLIECKWSDGDVSKSLKYLKQRVPEAAAYQITATGTRHYRTKEQIEVLPAHVFLKQLTL